MEMRETFRKAMSATSLTVGLIILVVLAFLLFKGPLKAMWKSSGDSGQKYLDLIQDKSCRQQGREPNYYEKQANAKLEEGLNNNDNVKFEEAAELFIEFSRCYGELAEIEINDPRSKIVLADSLYEKGKSQEALFVYNDYIENNENDDQLKDALFGAGRIYFEEGEWENASAILEELKKSNPNFKADEVSFMLGAAKAYLGDRNGNQQQTQEGLELVETAQRSGGASQEIRERTMKFKVSFYIRRQQWSEALNALDELANSGNPEAEKWAKMQKAETNYYMSLQPGIQYDEKIQKLRDAIHEYEDYINSFAQEDRDKKWQELQIDLAYLKECRIYHEIANNEKKNDPGMATTDYAIAEKLCQKVVDDFDESVYIPSAEGMLKIIEEDRNKP